MHIRGESPSAGGEQPEMSVVVGTPDIFETVATTLGYLANQTVAGKLEIVLVCPDQSVLEVPAHVREPFHSVTVVEARTNMSLAVGNAAGVRAARALIVALAEDHSFPEPEWAEHLLERHRGPWAVVGPVLKNANPENTVSDADFLIAYAMWSHPRPHGPADYLPGHNSSYKREVLLALGDDLEHYMNAEYVLHAHLRQKGERLYLEPQAVTSHTNFSRWSSYLPMHVNAGRSFAASRARDWSLPKRALYIAASPLIPLVRLKRVLAQSHASSYPVGAIVRCIPALFSGLVFSALGEALGYALGEGRSRSRLAFYEFHRYRHTVSGQYLPAPVRSAALSPG